LLQGAGEIMREVLDLVPVRRGLKRHQHVIALAAGGLDEVRQRQLVEPLVDVGRRRAHSTDVDTFVVIEVQGDLVRAFQFVDGAGPAWRPFRRATAACRSARALSRSSPLRPRPSAWSCRCPTLLRPCRRLYSAFPARLPPPACPGATLGTRRGGLYGRTSSCET